jgi:hypothetical protein
MEPAYQENRLPTDPYQILGVSKDASESITPAEGRYGETVLVVSNEHAPAAASFNQTLDPKRHVTSDNNVCSSGTNSISSPRHTDLGTDVDDVRARTVQE